MFLTSPISQADLQALETSTIKEFGLEEVGDGIWKEKVGVALLNAWLRDPSDTRIITYCMPLVLIQILRHKRLLQHSDLDDVFQSVILAVYEFLGKYQRSKGRLFTYLTMKIQFEVRDLANTPKIVHSKNTIELVAKENMAVGEDDAIHFYYDFMAYLYKRRRQEGKTSRRILTAMVNTLHSRRLNVQKQCHLVEAVCSKTQLPKVLIKNYLDLLLREYQTTPTLEADHANSNSR